MRQICLFFICLLVNLVKCQDEISTDETLTRYLLWTKANPSSKQELVFESIESVNSSNFNASKPTKVLVHGFADGGTTGWVIGSKREFLKKGSKIFYYP